MAMRREAALIVIIITCTVIVCMRMGISFHSGLMKLSSHTEGCGVCTGDGGYRTPRLGGLRGAAVVRRRMAHREGSKGTLNKASSNG